MQVIETKHLGPTNSRPTRIKAEAEAGSVILPWDDSLGIEGNHQEACRKLRENLGWVAPYYSPMVGGQTKSGSYVWVFTNLISPRVEP